MQQFYQRKIRTRGLLLLLDNFVRSCEMWMSFVFIKCFLQVTYFVKCNWWVQVPLFFLDDSSRILKKNTFSCSKPLYSYYYQALSWVSVGSVYRVFQTSGITAGGDFLGFCDQKSSYKHVSDFGRLRSYGRFLIPVCRKDVSDH